MLVFGGALLCPMSFAHLRGQQARGHVSLHATECPLVLAQLHSVDQMGVSLPDLAEREVQ